MREAGLTLGQELTTGVRLSTRQFTLVADDGATSKAFVAATVEVQRRVADVTGVVLAPEPDPVGHLPDYDSLIDSVR